MSVTTYRNGIPLVSIPALISTSPSNGATLPWNGTNKSYQWTTSLTVTTQNQSSIEPSPAPLQKYIYTGLNINVGMWIANLSSGLVWQIVSISAKSSTTVNCTLEDISRYNTYRDPSKSGNGKPSTGLYVIFNLGDMGLPMVDPVPTGAGSNFAAVLNSRFQYINKQYDLVLNQPGFTTVSFNYGDVIAIDQPTQTFVLADNSYINTVVGTVTSIDDTGTLFTVNPIRKVVDNLDYLPGQVGDVIYTDNSNPGQLTTTSGGASVYLKLRNNTQSTTTSAVFADTVTPITTPGYTFYVNNVTTSISGSGIPNDVVIAINTTTPVSGVSATLQTVPVVQIIITATDARAITFTDISGSVTTDAGLISVENGIKAIGLIVTGTSSGGTPPIGLTNAYGYVFTQTSPLATWTIVHNAGSSDVSTQIYNTGSINTLATLVGGSSYVDGTYTDVLLAGGTGDFARATIVVSGGSVTTVTLTNPGNGFTVSDVLSTSNANLGGSGSGFTINVGTLQTQTVIFPDEITVVDVNTVQVTFASVQAGKAYLTIFV